MEKHIQIGHVNYEFIDKRQANGNNIPFKVYEARESVLTELFKHKQIWTVHNIGVSIFLMLATTTLAHDIIYKQEINMGTTLIMKGFANFHIFWIIWICMFATSIIPFFGFKLWVTTKNLIRHKSGRQEKLWNQFCLMTYILYISCFLYYYTRAAIDWGLGEALRAAVVLENVRHVMKMYAFVRNNTAKFLNRKGKTASKSNLSFNHYVYFLFAPVLVYQDAYPRSNTTVRWCKVGYYMLNMILGIIFYSFLLESAYIQDLQNYGLILYTWKDILYITLKYSPQGLLMAYLLCYMGLHSWFNAFAEMLQFSDRLFYKDWWAASNDKSFLRRWNVVVHDWLYMYVYRDLCILLGPTWRTFATVVVMLLSGVGHDYVLSISLGYCIPVFSVQYLIVTFISNFQFENTTVGSIYMIFRISLHFSLLATFYTMEYFARLNCPIEGDNFANLFKPRFLSCGP